MHAYNIMNELARYACMYMNLHMKLLRSFQLHSTPAGAKYLGQKAGLLQFFLNIIFLLPFIK